MLALPAPPPFLVIRLSAGRDLDERPDSEKIWRVPVGCIAGPIRDPGAG